KKKIIYGTSNWSSEITVSELNVETGILLDLDGHPFSAGDINADGYRDLLVVDSSYNSSRGRVSILYGGNSLPSVIDESYVDGINGFKIQGTSSSELVGRTFGVLGDVNGDGFDDLSIGSKRYQSTSYIIFGGSYDWPAT